MAEMDRTTHLQLRLFQGSDVVNYQDFNDNFNQIDRYLGVNYVEEEGNMDRWWYRKWANGRAECGIDNKAMGDSNMVLWNDRVGLYISKEYNFGAYLPLTFQRRPYCSITFNYCDEPKTSPACFIIQRPQPKGYQSPTFLIVSTFSSQFKNVQCGIYCTGYWKNSPIGSD